jgi:hypothetical protein
MREKLNENPVAQIALIAVLLVVGGYLMMSQLSGGEGGEESAAPVSSVSAEPVAEASEAGAEEEAGAVEAEETAVTPPMGRSLPKPVETAYSSGATVVLLVVRDGGIDDHLVERAADALRGDPEVQLFVVPVHEVARYTPVTGPLGVDRAPALIVIRPRSFNSDGPAPASVTYGFQRTADVQQAVRDAVYQGPQLSYAPN